MEEGEIKAGIYAPRREQAARRSVFSLLLLLLLLLLCVRESFFLSSFLLSQFIFSHRFPLRRFIWQQSAVLPIARMPRFPILFLAVFGFAEERESNPSGSKK